MAAKKKVTKKKVTKRKPSVKKKAKTSTAPVPVVTSPDYRSVYDVTAKKHPCRFTDKQRLAITAEMCDRMAEGESVRAIIRCWRVIDPEHLCYPDTRTVRRWVMRGHRPGATELERQFAAMYREGMELRAETIHDEIYEIADEPCESNVECYRAKTRIWARMWSLGKMAPKVYGDKIQQEHTGSITVTHKPFWEQINEQKDEK